MLHMVQFNFKSDLPWVSPPSTSAPGSNRAPDDWPPQNAWDAMQKWDVPDGVNEVAITVWGAGAEMHKYS